MLFYYLLLDNQGFKNENDIKLIDTSLAISWNNYIHM